VSRWNPTLGCVSLPLPRLLTVLRWLRPARDPLIVIGTRATIRRF
jgi:L,D-peptidoglycan transpeptidase YkuD (ErfK/YbiS/YcfS/YnhG family)